MLALIFTRKFRPMIIGSSSGWLTLAGMMARPRATSSRTNSGVEAFPRGDEGHLRRDLAAARVRELRHGLPVARPATRAGAGRERRRHLALPRVEQQVPRLLDRVAAAFDPLAAQLRQALADVHALRTAGVVHADRRVAARQRDLAHGHAHAERTVHEHLAGARERLFVGQQRWCGGCGRLGHAVTPHGRARRAGPTVAGLRLRQAMADWSGRRHLL